MKIIFKKVACRVLFAAASTATISAQPDITVPSNQSFTIEDAQVKEGVPDDCDEAIYRWWRDDSRLIGSGQTLTVAGGTLAEGTYKFQRITRCGDCGQAIFSPKVTVEVGAPQALSNDATLSGITLGAWLVDDPATDVGELLSSLLSPAFAPNVTSYLLPNAPIPDNLISSISVTGIANHSGATVEGNVSNRALPPGDNVITLTVTAEDGTTQKVYTITITVMGASDDANLGWMEFNTEVLPAGTTISPPFTFTATTTTYTVNVPHCANTITVTGHPRTEGATVDGNVSDLPLSVGDNTPVTLTVTAKDGVTQKIYTFTINRAGEEGSATDSDGNCYRTKIYGGVEWMIDNAKKPLGTADGCTGNSIDGGNYGNECYMGHLYSWNCAAQVCPDGWRLPNDDDFNNLIAALGDDDAAWVDWNVACAMAGYSYDYDYGGMQSSLHGFWWSSTSERPWHATRGYKTLDLSNGNGNGRYFYSVRCVKNP
jgi:uncharacterized protein (TIGR02145 family)